jgi:hypothetical protein
VAVTDSTIINHAEPRLIYTRHEGRGYMLKLAIVSQEDESVLHLFPISASRLKRLLADFAQYNLKDIPNGEA